MSDIELIQRLEKARTFMEAAQDDIKAAQADLAIAYTAVKSVEIALERRQKYLAQEDTNDDV